MAFLEIYHKFNDMDSNDFAVIEFTIEQSKERGFIDETWPECDFNQNKIDEFKASLKGLTWIEYLKSTKEL